MAERIKLTPGRIDKAICPPGKQQTILRDSEQPGLGLRITAGGSKVYVFQAKISGEVVRVKIGDLKTFTLSEARSKAAELRALVIDGRDPRIVKAERAASDEAKRTKAKNDKLQAIEAWPLYVAHCSTRQKRPWSDRSKLEHIRLADPGGKPKTRGRKKGEGDTTQPGALYALLQLPLVKIDADAIESWLKENSYRPAVAEFGYVRLRGFMRWCARQKAYRGQVSLEAFGDDNVREQVPDIGARSDRLRRSDLKAWFQAVRGLANPVHAAYLQITLLTGCRRRELAPLRWADVDFAHGALRLDGKTGVRIIPIPPYIRALLLDLRQRNQAGPNVVSMNGEHGDWKPSPFVFHSTTAKSGYVEEPRYSHEKALKAAGLDHVSIHGLRRTFGSLSDSVGVDLPHGVVLQIQGHKPQGVAEQHYRVRELEELAPWHAQYERWLLEQAEIDLPKKAPHQKEAVAA